MPSIRTSDVVGQLRRSYDAEAKALAGSNTVISKTEAAKVASTDLRGAIAAMADGQPGVRLTVDRVVDEAIKRALQRLGAVNATGTGFVSKAEVDAIKARLPDLGNRFAAAYDVAKAGGVPPTPPAVVDAVKAALTPWAGGALPTLDVRLVKETSSARVVEVDVRRNDGKMITAKLTLGLGAKAKEVQAVQLFTDAFPVTGVTVATLENTLKATAPGATVLGYVERVDARSGRAEFLTAYATPRASGGRDVRLATVDPASVPPSVKPAALTGADELTARGLALMMAKRQAYELVAASGEDAPKLEYHLRTAALKPSSLARITQPADSAVGFDPTTDAFQFQLPRVWGDNAVVVTFAKDGAARLEDVN
jgi:hypothetical protein